MTSTPSILVVDDDASFIEAFTAFADLHGWSTDPARSLAAGQAAVTARNYDLIIMDLVLPDGNGMDLLEGIDLGGSGQVVIITANPSVESAISALRLPVVDYLVKPVNGEKIQQLLKRAAASRVLRRQPVPDEDGCGELRGDSAAMRHVYDQIRRVAQLDVTVFINGESGTGKELAARAIHDISARRGRLVSVNCGAVAPELLTSQLFGHRKGAFTGAVRDHAGLFEQAQHGTLFLDEITEMPPGLQAHLLRVLETREITRVGDTEGRALDVRVIAASNHDPLQAVSAGLLRSDLYYRLMDFPLSMPPLRDRPEDIPLLAAHALDRLNRRYGTVRAFATDAIDRLLAHDWPGNVRELKHVVQRGYILSENTVAIERIGPAPKVNVSHDLGFRVGMSIEEMERKMLLRTLDFFENDKTRTAKALGVSLKTVYNKLSRYENEP